MKEATRQEKEQLYIRKMTELQLRWKNPINSDWDFSDWTDEQLDKGLEDIIGQLRFEKGWDLFTSIVVLGVLGLLFL